MHSIRTRIALLNVIAITVAISVATTISAVTISNLGHSSSEQSMSLLCEYGKSNLNSYFKSVEQSVNTVSKLISTNLNTIPDDQFNTKLSNHVEQARILFNEAAKNTNGVLTFYYRIDPTISDVTGEKGFWYTNTDGKGFVEHEVTDLSDDQYECIWFYRPKYTQQPLWLPPYVTDNLGEYVISYNVPVYRNSGFVGVVGIEIGYLTIGEQIKDIKALKTGFAFIIENKDCTIIYHPEIDILETPEKDRPPVPKNVYDAVKAGNPHHISYTFGGVEKHGYWLDLANGMSIIVSAPASEVNENWVILVWTIVAIAAVILAAFIILTILSTSRITKPLRQLTEAAEKINNDDYNVQLDYKNDDEIGVLTSAFGRLVDHLRGYIEDLSSLAYADALTEVHNKSAFDVAMKKIQEQIDNKEEVKFAIGVFDCDDLKIINDAYGHDNGNIYLRNSSRLIAVTFQHSEVYRLGGDEFAVILQGEDYDNRDKLHALFSEKLAEISALAKEPWERIRVSVGIASFDPEVDQSAHDVVVHADHKMYANKRERKKNKKD